MPITDISTKIEEICNSLEISLTEFEPIDAHEDSLAVNIDILKNDIIPAMESLKSVFSNAEASVISAASIYLKENVADIASIPNDIKESLLQVFMLSGSENSITQIAANVVENAIDKCSSTGDFNVITSYVQEMISEIRTGDFGTLFNDGCHKIISEATNILDAHLNGLSTEEKIKIAASGAGDELVSYNRNENGTIDETSINAVSGMSFNEDGSITDKFGITFTGDVVGRIREEDSSEAADKIREFALLLNDLYKGQDGFAFLDEDDRNNLFDSVKLVAAGFEVPEHCQESLEKYGKALQRLYNVEILDKQIITEAVDKCFEKENPEFDSTESVSSGFQKAAFDWEDFDKQQINGKSSENGTENKQDKERTEASASKNHSVGKSVEAAEALSHGRSILWDKTGNEKIDRMIEKRNNYIKNDTIIPTYRYRFGYSYANMKILFSAKLNGIEINGKVPTAMDCFLAFNAFINTNAFEALIISVFEGVSDLFRDVKPSKNDISTDNIDSKRQAASAEKVEQLKELAVEKLENSVKDMGVNISKVLEKPESDRTARDKQSLVRTSNDYYNSVKNIIKLYGTDSGTEQIKNSVVKVFSNLFSDSRVSAKGIARLSLLIEGRSRFNIDGEKVEIKFGDLFTDRNDSETKVDEEDLDDKAPANNIEMSVDETADNGMEKSEDKVSDEDLKEPEGEVSDEGMEEPENEISAEDMERSETKVSDEGIEEPESKVSDENMEKSESEVSDEGMEEPENEISAEDMERSETKVSDEGIEEPESKVSDENMEKSESEVSDDDVETPENKSSSDDVEKSDNTIPDEEKSKYEDTNRNMDRKKSEEKKSVGEKISLSKEEKALKNQIEKILQGKVTADAVKNNPDLKNTIADIKNAGNKQNVSDSIAKVVASIQKDKGTDLDQNKMKTICKGLENISKINGTAVKIKNIISKAASFYKQYNTIGIVDPTIRMQMELQSKFSDYIKAKLSLGVVKNELNKCFNATTISGTMDTFLDITSKAVTNTIVAFGNRISAGEKAVVSRINNIMGSIETVSQISKDKICAAIEKNGTNIKLLVTAVVAGIALISFDPISAEAVKNGENRIESVVTGDSVISDLQNDKQKSNILAENQEDDMNRMDSDSRMKEPEDSASEDNREEPEDKASGDDNREEPEDKASGEDQVETKDKVSEDSQENLENKVSEDDREETEDKTSEDDEEELEDRVANDEEGAEGKPSNDNKEELEDKTSDDHLGEPEDKVSKDGWEKPEDKTSDDDREELEDKVSEKDLVESENKTSDDDREEPEDKTSNDDLEEPEDKVSEEDLVEPENKTSDDDREEPEDKTFNDNLEEPEDKVSEENQVESEDKASGDGREESEDKASDDQQEKTEDNLSADDQKEKVFDNSLEEADDTDFKEDREEPEALVSDDDQEKLEDKAANEHLEKAEGIDSAIDQFTPEGSNLESEIESSLDSQNENYVSDNSHNFSDVISDDKRNDSDIDSLLETAQNVSLVVPAETEDSIEEPEQSFENLKKSTNDEEGDSKGTPSLEDVESGYIPDNVEIPLSSDEVQANDAMTDFKSVEISMDSSIGDTNSEDLESESLASYPENTNESDNALETVIDAIASYVTESDVGFTDFLDFPLQINGNDMTINEAYENDAISSETLADAVVDAISSDADNVLRNEELSKVYGDLLTDISDMCGNSFTEVLCDKMDPMATVNDAVNNAFNLILEDMATANVDSDFQPDFSAMELAEFEFSIMDGIDAENIISDGVEAAMNDITQSPVDFTMDDGIDAALSLQLSQDFNVDNQGSSSDMAVSNDMQDAINDYNSVAQEYSQDNFMESTQFNNQFQDNSIDNMEQQPSIPNDDIINMSDIASSVDLGV